MAMWVVALLSLSVIISTSLAVSTPASSSQMNQDLLKATADMQNANYYTFVMLLNMAPPNKIPGNITFLMPNDRMLAKTAIREDSVLDFLLRHSIPYPLPFDFLDHFPSGSTIPSSEPDYFLRISNAGGLSFFLNNVKITRPNICTSAASIRCHGIDDVLGIDDGLASPTPPCNATTAAAPSPVAGMAPAPGAAAMTPSPAGMAMPPATAPAPIAGLDFNVSPTIAPQAGDPEAGGNPRHSGSNRWSLDMVFWMVLLVVGRLVDV